MFDIEQSSSCLGSQKKSMAGGQRVAARGEPTSLHWSPATVRGGETERCGRESMRNGGSLALA